MLQPDLERQGIALRFKLMEQFSFPGSEQCRAVHHGDQEIYVHADPGGLSGAYQRRQRGRSEVEAGKVLAAIGKHGAYASVVFDDGVTQAAIVLAYGGWPKLCADCGVEESEHWFRKNFVKTWAAYARQGVKYTGHLPGIFEITNRSNGHYDHIPPPQLVGDPPRPTPCWKPEKVPSCSQSTRKTCAAKSVLCPVCWKPCLAQGGGNHVVSGAAHG